MLILPQLIADLEALRGPDADLDKIRVSALSLAYDAVWDFTVDLTHRPRTVSNAKLRLDWSKYGFSLPLRRELQKIFCLYYKAPKLFGRHDSVKPNSFCAMMARCNDFLDDVLRETSSHTLIGSLAQLDPADLAAAAARHSGRSHFDIRRGLRIVFSQQAAKALGVTLAVTQQDIKRLSFPSSTKPAVSSANAGGSYFPDELFSALSDAATSRVLDFLTRLNIPCEDTSCHPFNAPSEIEAIPDFPKGFEIYEQWRRTNKRVPISSRSEGALREDLRKAGVRMGAMNNYLSEVNTAAQCVIALYSGARFSELTSLKVGCLSSRDNVPCIIGRQFKTKSDNNLADDSWIAVPAVADAVHALEALARIKNKTYLFSSLETAKGDGLRGSDLSYTCTGFINSLRIFISAAGLAELFSNNRVNTHVFRHSLIRQMIKVKLGLPYISYHMKHLHSRLVRLPSDVTLAYGNAARLLQSTTAGIHLDEIRREFARKLYDPDSLVQGGAARQFHERRKAYFEGMVGSGLTKEEIIADLAATFGSAFVNVGLGYCTGRRGDSSDAEAPPCIGSLRCNPSRCANAIITKDHASAWKKVYIENVKMARDPRFSYARVELQALADEAKQVLDRLEEEIPHERETPI